jgi:beta-phosphoglucomutase-like phosphatase (HAD superfamily)
MSIVAIVFDFDGVIADTERLHLGAFQEVFADRGWQLNESDYFDRYLGCDDRGLVVTYGRDNGIALQREDVEALVAAKASAFSRHLGTGDVLFPGAKAAIEGLAARFSTAIASGALHHEIASILDAAGLIGLFPVIVGADDVATTKPSPEPYLTAALRLGVAPSSCVAIEDSIPGLQAARSAGMRTIAITTTSPGDALTGADRIVRTLAEVTPELVADLGTPKSL